MINFGTEMGWTSSQGIWIRARLARQCYLVLKFYWRNVGKILGTMPSGITVVKLCHVNNDYEKVKNVIDWHFLCHQTVIYFRPTTFLSEQNTFVASATTTPQWNLFCTILNYVFSGRIFL